MPRRKISEEKIKHGARYFFISTPPLFSLSIYSRNIPEISSPLFLAAEDTHVIPEPMGEGDFEEVFSIHVFGSRFLAFC